MDTSRDDVPAPERCLSRRRLLAGICIKAEGDRVNCNAPTRAFPKFAYDQRKARRRQGSSGCALSRVVWEMALYYSVRYTR